MSQSVNLKISIVGAGYVGLVTGLCLCEIGHQVTCIDVDEARIRLINLGETPIYEKGLDALLIKHLGNTFEATTDLNASVINSDITIIAVGTPFNEDTIDLSFVKQVAGQIGRALRKKEGYHIVAVKSTVVPGTTDEIVKPLIEQESQKLIGNDIGLCMNPEFLREGQAVQDCLYPDRIIIGGTDEKSVNLYEKLYAGRQYPIIKTNNRTAEMTKYAANALFGTLISFANEIANLCEQTEGVDVIRVMEGIYNDRRMHYKSEDQIIFPGFVDYLKPGCGFGGSCFPKDLSALAAYGKKVGLETPMLKATLIVNHDQPEKMISHLFKYFTSMDGVHVGILGIAFKPGTDDIRCSPAIHVIKKLLAQGAQVSAYDPIVKVLTDDEMRQVNFAVKLTDILDSVDVVMIFTADEEFMMIPTWIAKNRADLIVIDGRRQFRSHEFKNYSGIGKHDIV